LELRQIGGGNPARIPTRISAEPNQFNLMLIPLVIKFKQSSNLGLHQQLSIAIQLSSNKQYKQTK